MSSAKIKASLPDNNRNGLAHHADKFVDDPDTLKLVIAVLDTKSTSEDRDTGEVCATVRIRRIEVVEGKGDLREAQRLMMRAHEVRSGKSMLPFDTEKDLESAFAAWVEESVDTDTGEIRDDDE